MSAITTLIFAALLQPGDAEKLLGPQPPCTTCQKEISLPGESFQMASRPQGEPKRLQNLRASRSSKASKRREKDTRRTRLRAGFLARRKAKRFDVDPDATAQQQAQQKANFLARNRLTGHPGSTIGDFEGTGHTDGSGLAPTCTPPPGYKKIADASAKGAAGTHRVRAWVKAE